MVITATISTLGLFARPMPYLVAVAHMCQGGASQLIPLLRLSICILRCHQFGAMLQCIASISPETHTYHAVAQLGCKTPSAWLALHTIEDMSPQRICCPTWPPAGADCRTTHMSSSHRMAPPIEAATSCQAHLLLLIMALGVQRMGQPCSSMFSHLSGGN